MITGINQQLLSGMFGSVGGSSGGLPLPRTKYAPTAPWTQPQTPKELSDALKSVVAGRKRFIDEGAAQLDLKGASDDYRKLFALYQGLATLMSVAEEAGKKNVQASDRSRLEQAFVRGMSEISQYVDKAQLEKIRLIQGEASATTKTTAPILKTKTEYQTPPLVKGSTSQLADAFQGNVQFNIQVKRANNTTHNVAIDLANMGAQPRSLANVVNYINQQLQASGVDSRIATHRIPGGDKTTQVNGKTVKIGTEPDQWAMKVVVAGGEKVGFSAPATAGAVYVSQHAGNPDPDGKADTKDSVERERRRADA